MLEQVKEPHKCFMCSGHKDYVVIFNISCWVAEGKNPRCIHEKVEESEIRSAMVADNTMIKR